MPPSTRMRCGCLLPFSLKNSNRLRHGTVPSVGNFLPCIWLLNTFGTEMEFKKILFHFNLFPKFQVEKVLINDCLTNIFRPSLHFHTVPKQKIFLKLLYI